MKNLAGLDPERVLQDSMSSICAVLEEQKHKKQTQPVPISGPELAALMKVGTRVVRGVDWKWGDQVGKMRTPSNILDRFFTSFEHGVGLST